MKQHTLLSLAILLFLIGTISAQGDEIDLRLDGSSVLKVKQNPHGYTQFFTDFNDSNLFFGFDVGSKSGQGAIGVNDGKFNIGIGNQALQDNTVGISNLAIGNFALLENVSGNSNVALGQGALLSNVSGNLNTAIGVGALGGNTTGSSNAALGLNAMANMSSGSNNVAVGYRAAVFDTSGQSSVYVGASAGAGGNTFSDTHEKDNNVMIGYHAGNQSQGSHNVFLGYRAGEFENGDHKLYIANGNDDSTQALIYGEFDNQLLRINGALNIDGLYTLPITSGANGQIMKRNLFGQLFWANDDDGPWDFSGNDLIFEDGNVGIGDDAPSVALAVSGNVRSSTNQSETEYVEILHDGADGIINTVGDGLLRIGHDGNTAMSIDATGNVDVAQSLGVGVVGASDALHVRAQGSDHLFRVQLGTSTKMRVYNNGSIALGSNNTGISAGDVYITNQLGIGRITPLHPLHVGTNGTNGNGAHVTIGGTWTNGSSRAFKENFRKADGRSILAALSELEVMYWDYKDSDEGTHLGPIAEEFYTAFGLGHDAQYISTVDADGVALAAIKALNVKLEEENAELRSALEALTERVALLETQ